MLYGIDARADREIAWLEEHYGSRAKELFPSPLCSSDIMPKILWLKNNEPDIYRRAHKFITGSTYLTAKLTGRYYIDKLLALSSFRPAYRADGTIDEAECALFCRPDQLAECVPTAYVVGCVTPEAARQTGLAEGTPVITGTDDAAAEAVSTGVVANGDLMLMFGSSCFMYYCVDRLVRDERIWSSEYVVPGTYSISAGTNTAGTLTRWFRDNIFWEVMAEQERTGVNAYDLMLEGIDDIPAGSEAVSYTHLIGMLKPIRSAAAMSPPMA